MPKSDDLSAWKLFLSLAESRSFSVTGEAFGLEPSSVSRAITALENSLGQKLISRSERPIALTPKGVWAAKKIEPVIAAHQKIIDQITKDNASLEGTIRLSVAPGFATHYLMPVLARFSEIWPGVTFDIQVGMKASDLKTQKCDVAALTGDPADPHLVALPRGRNVYLPLASPLYVREHGMPITPADLEQHTVLMYTGPVRPTTRTLWKQGQEMPISFGKTMASSDILAIRQGVLSGTGVAVDLPLVQVWEDIRDGRLVPILPGWRHLPVDCFIALSRSSWHLRRCRVFAEWFAKEMRMLFQSFEDAVSGIVPLPPQSAGSERNAS